MKVDHLRDEKRFSKFVDILSKHKGLRDELDNVDRFIVFAPAPANAAFKRLEEDHKHEADDDWDIKYILISFASSSRPVINSPLPRRRRGDHRQRPPRWAPLIPTSNSGTLTTTATSSARSNLAGWPLVHLSMKTRVEDEDIKADNGRIHAINRVLIPPAELYDVLWKKPSMFSTFIVAAERTGMAKDIEDEKAMIVCAFCREGEGDLLRGGDYCRGRRAPQCQSERRRMKQDVLGQDSGETVARLGQFPLMHVLDILRSHIVDEERSPGRAIMAPLGSGGIEARGRARHCNESSPQLSFVEQYTFEEDVEHAQQ
ncbi:hypothetical protein BDK51DRAFT_50652 [Blyttiomyces helicus]|uniref:FAS1 domain-containing protein n=1 Tax=Blyttiomyces helicus TaxID=388810 RepID=A0A4P9W755_9FUNG|nr:hypothetical protein BDK51DRAFT_50652 [Blyttiomyces helicus]|eukprot:RKO87223.1 hypothetical protein BDK51DRAFT_50652 [Blyttiomyces helicus]